MSNQHCSTALSLRNNRPLSHEKKHGAGVLFMAWLVFCGIFFCVCVWVVLIFFGLCFVVVFIFVDVCILVLIFAGLCFCC